MVRVIMPPTSPPGTIGGQQVGAVSNAPAEVSIGIFTGFTLDDPVLGVLDGFGNTLDGEIEFQEVTSGVVSVSVSRGRNRDLDRTNAGQLSVSFRNENRQFDPTAQETFSALVRPRLPVQVKVNPGPRPLEREIVFTGLVDDWAFDYEVGGQSVATLVASDAFGLFAREENTGVSAVEELSGARVNRALNNLKIVWPQLERDVDTGNATLAAGVLEGNALQYLQTVEGSESGLIFMTKDGKFAFRERLIQPITDALTFTDEGEGIPYVDIAISFGTDLMANDVTVTSPAGTATSVDATSRVVYGVIERTIDTFLAAGSLQALADYVRFRYGVPEYRIESVTVDMRALTAQQRADVLGLELGDQADVIFTPNKTGTRIPIRNRLVGISHNIGVDSHRVSFSFEALPFEFFVLDDAVFGKLDNTDGVLGF